MEHWKMSGKISMVWFGPTPRVILSDPKLVREVLSNKFRHLQKPKLPSNFIKLIAQGLTVHEGEKWALHRKIIKPAFHLEKLKVMNGPITLQNISGTKNKALSCRVYTTMAGCLN
jgi:cytochrome P450